MMQRKLSLFAESPAGTDNPGRVVRASYRGAV